MSGGLAMRPARKFNETPAEQDTMPEQDDLLMRLVESKRRQQAELAAKQAPPADVPPAPVAPRPKLGVESLFGKATPQGGETPDPNTFELVETGGGDVKFLDPKTKKVYDSMQLRKIPGHEGILRKGTERQLGM